MLRQKLGIDVLYIGGTFTSGRHTGEDTEDRERNGDRNNRKFVLHSMTDKRQEHVGGLDGNEVLRFLYSEKSTENPVHGKIKMDVCF